MMPPDVLHQGSSQPAAPAPVSSTPTTPSDAIGGAMPLRFRDRVRGRAGASDVLAFTLARERFACDVRALDEAIEAPEMSPAPGTPVAALAGVLRLLGRTVPVFDAGTVLGVAGGDRRQLLLLRAGEDRVGLLVDDVDDVEPLAFSTVKPPPYEGGDELLLGVTWDGARLTGILDARALVVSCQHRLREGVGA